MVAVDLRVPTKQIGDLSTVNQSNVSKLNPFSMVRHGRKQHLQIPPSFK